MSKWSKRQVRPTYKGVTLAADNGTLHAFKRIPVADEYGKFVTACGRVVSGVGIETDKYRPLTGEKPCARCAAIRPESVPPLEVT